MPQPINPQVANRSRLQATVASPSADPTGWEPQWAVWYERKRQKGISRSQLEVYRYNQRRIDIFRADHKINSVAAFTPAKILEFRSELEASGLSRMTVHQHMRTLRTFLIDVGSWPEGKAKDGLLPKLTSADHRIEFFTAEQKNALRLAATRPRDRMMVEVLLRTGIRESELIGLTVNSFPDTNLRVVGKGRKERSIPLVTAQGDLGRELRLYMRNHRPAVSSDTLFVQSRRPYDPITKAVVDRLCLMLQEKTGIHVFTHKFRHTFATDLLRQGVNLVVLKDLLGHESLEMVLVYAHVVGAHLQAEMARVEL